jgi:hypothetical protein
MSYKDKIKCFFGFHDWEYSSWEDGEGNRFSDLNYLYKNLSEMIEKRYHYPSRFCQCCFKKQKRHIVDLGRTILWKDTDKLTLKEIRQKKLKKLLNE